MRNTFSASIKQLTTNMLMKKGLYTFLIFGLFINKTYGQEFSKNSLTYGFGIGLSASEGYNYSGSGPALIMGYKRDIWKDRLRFNPNLTFGSYRDGKHSDTKDEYFNTMNLNLSLELDFLRYNAFSLNIEGGGLVGTTNGLKGTGLEFDHDQSSSFRVNESKFIDNFNYGAILGCGIRFSPLKSRYAVKLTPLNLHLGNNGFSELHSFISIDMKLK